MRGLYTTPIVDSYLWWGDESWLMLEFRTQIVEGVFRHPLALGSTLSHGNGVVFSNMWLTAVLYGLPSALFPSTDIVAIGRTVTAAMAVTLIIATYLLARRAGASAAIALFATALLLTSRSFFLTSHSARYDILSALSILLAIGFMLWRAALHVSFTKRELIVLGGLWASGLLISIHVLLVLSLPVLALLVLQRAMRVKDVALFGLGVLVVAGVVLIVSSLTGSLSLFGTSGSNSFASNLHDIPAFRPFSRSVQTANLVQRLTTFWMLGRWFILAIAPLVTLYGILALRAGKRPSPLPLLVGAALTGWLLFESAAPTSYLIYVLPLLSVLTAHVLARVALRPIQSLTLSAMTVALIILGWRDASIAITRGDELTARNCAAVQNLLDSVGPGDRLLAINPAVNNVHSLGRQVMTTHFIEFPVSSRSVLEVISSEHINRLLLYESPLIRNYMREVVPLRDAASQKGRLVRSSVGVFTDIGRSYFERDNLLPDTLKLFEMHD